MLDAFYSVEPLFLLAVHSIVPNVLLHGCPEYASKMERNNRTKAAEWIKFFFWSSMAWVQIYLDKFQVKKQSIVKIINNNYLICWGEFVCDQGRLSLFYMRQLCDLRRSICKANSGVLNRHHDARGKFLPAGICSVLTFVVLAHVWAGLYPPDSSWTTIELPLKVLQGPNFPMLILCAAIKLMLFIYSLAPQWFGCSIHSFSNCSVYFDVCVRMGQKYRKISKTCFF